MAPGAVAVDQIEHHELFAQGLGHFGADRRHKVLEVVSVGASGKVVALKEGSPRRLDRIRILDVLLVEFV